MSNLIDSVREELLGLEADIPQYIKTGIPENIKSGNLRSIELRNNQAVQMILEIIETLDNENVLSGVDEPNTVPPDEYSVGSLYIRKDEEGSNIALYIYTGIDELGWLIFENKKAPKVVYGNIANPNIQPPPGNFVVGDIYVRTSDATENGNVISVWLYTNFHSGKKWKSFSDSEGGGGTTKLITAISFSGNSTKTLRIDFDDESFLTANFDDNNTIYDVAKSNSFTNPEEINVPFLWTPNILQNWKESFYSKKEFIIENGFVIDGLIDYLIFDHPGTFYEIEIALENSGYNWDINWKEEFEGDKEIGYRYKSLKEVFALFQAENKHPLTLKLINDQVFIEGGYEGEGEESIIIPGGSILTIF